MKLLFVVSQLGIGGAERHTLELARALEMRGQNCTVVSIRSKSTTKLDAQTTAGLTIHHCDAKGFVDWRAVKTLAGLAGSYEPDVIVGVNQYALMYSHLACKLTSHRSDIAIVFHSTELRTTKDRWLNHAYKFFFARSDLLVYVCDFQANYWREKGLKARRQVVVHNGIDTLRFAPLANQTRCDTRLRYGIRDDEFVIGITAAFRPEKNHIFLLKALQALLRSGVKAKLLMVGDGPLREELEHQAADLNVSNAAIFAGAHADVRPLVAAFDVFALVSWTETFSLAALEAMAMGIPAILSDVGGAREMVLDGENGFTFAVNDMDGFLNAVHQVMTGNSGHTMGQAAQQLVNSRFTHQRMVNCYDQIFQTLLPEST